MTRARRETPSAARGEQRVLAVTETHSLLWHANRRFQKLGPRARRLAEGEPQALEFSRAVLSNVEIKASKTDQIDREFFEQFDLSHIVKSVRYATKPKKK